VHPAARRDRRPHNISASAATLLDRPPRLEQQANIVDDWFAGSGRQALPKEVLEAQGLERDGMIEDERLNPHFRYIRDNIRSGIA
jgi:hypothetical protein